MNLHSSGIPMVSLEDLRNPQHEGSVTMVLLVVVIIRTFKLKKLRGHISSDY